MTPSGTHTTRIFDPWWLLVPIVAIGGVLRFKGIAFGLPHTQCRPDESRILNLALRIAGGDLNPHYFVYPTLYMYVLAGLIQVRGMLAGASEFRSAGIAQFLIYGRYLTAVFGTVTLLTVYVLGRRLVDAWCGLIAAALLSVAFLHVRDSHFGTLDVPMAFGVTLGLVLLTESGRGVWWLVMAGAAIGLAASLKYNATLLIPAALALEVYRVVSGAQPVSRAAYRVVVLGLAVAAGFAVGTPYALLDGLTFLSGVQYVRTQLSNPHVHEGRSLSQANAAWQYVSAVLPAAIGWPALALACAGLAMLTRRVRETSLPMLVFVALYCFITFRASVVFARYVVPLIPILCVTAALALRQCWGRFGRTGVTRLILSLATIGVMAPMASRSAELDLLLSRGDNRLVAGEWMERQLPSGASIWQSGSVYGQIQFNPASRFVELADERTLFATPPNYVVVQRSPLSLYSHISAAAEAFVNARYVLVRSFRTGLARLTEADYDASDAFFVPLRHLNDITRPGPEFDIYAARQDAR